MTIYSCKVAGCNSNSKVNNNLRFFVLPKDEERAKLWIKATSQDDLLDTVSTIVSSRWRDKFRVCSLHFLPTSIRNQRLADDAIPRLKLPAQGNAEEQSHHDVACDVCNSIISGYRYKCIACDDYDLCQNCEKSEEHQKHYLIRIIKPISSFEAKSLIKNLKSALYRNTFDHKEQVKVKTKPPPIECDSDDEPITKYQKNSDSALELSNEDRNRISNEVNRVLKLLNKKRKSVEGDNKSIKLVTKKMCNMSTQTPDSESSSESEHEVEFADVNDFKNEKPGEGGTLEEESEVKTEMDSILYTMLS